MKRISVGCLSPPCRSASSSRMRRRRMRPEVVTSRLSSAGTFGKADAREYGAGTRVDHTHPKSASSTHPRGRCPKARVGQAANRGCVSWSPILRVGERDQARACGARSHSSKAMRPRRARPRHQRALLDPAAEVSGLGVAHDLTRVADRLQIAGDEFVERCAFRAGDLDDTVSRRRERRLATMAATSSAAMG